MCTNGTAIAAQQQKPAADSSTMMTFDGSGRTDRSSAGRVPLLRCIGEART